MVHTSGRVRLDGEAHPPRRHGFQRVTPVATIERTITGDDRAADIRRWVCDALDEWSRGHVADVAQLLLTELVVNARRHGSPPVTVRAAPTSGGVRLEVADGGEGEPHVLYPGSQAPSGRGLLLVESMSARWGWERTSSSGKVVWVEL